VLDVGARPTDAMQLAQLVKDCAQGLMAMNDEVLSKKIDDMNFYDVMTIMKLINLISTELGATSGRGRVTTGFYRVALRSLNRTQIMERSNARSSLIRSNIVEYPAGGGAVRMGASVRETE